MPSDPAPIPAALCPDEALSRLAARAAAVDEAVCAAWSELFAGSTLALLAVGGYGRGRLFPHSDVDLLVLAGRDLASPAERDRLSELLRRLWDAGLRASHSWRTPAECCHLQPGNPELTVSLLHARFLAGNEELYAAFDAKWRRFVESRRRELAALLCRMMRARHARFHNTIHQLEPDVKEGPGGWRDLQTVEWLARLAAQAPPAEWTALASRVAQVRIFLHERRGRDHNVLDYESQEEAAAGAAPGPQARAEWMRGWYRNANAVLRMVLRAAEPWELDAGSRLSAWLDRTRGLANADFTVLRGKVYFRNPGHLQADAELPLRLFLFVARHGVECAPQTSGRLEPLAGGRVPGQAAGAPFWQELLAQPHAAAGLRAMRGSGWLAALLPEWERIDHLVVPDSSHQFTVDEHTNVAMEMLEALAGEKDPQRQPVAALWQECRREWWPLRLALLLHDIGKGSARDHVEESAAIAADFLRREGFAGREGETVLFLIRNHLLLSQAMQRADLADPAVLEPLARRIQTVEQLRLLVLMTYADISAVGPGMMTAWRLSRLISLYRTLYARLEGELDRLEEGPGAGAWSADARMLMEGLPARYRWSRTPAEIESEARLFAAVQRSGAEVSLSFSHGTWRAVILAADHECLFACLAGAISAHGMEILECEAFTHQAGFAVDVFRFADPHRTLELNPPEQERLAETLRRAALGQIAVEPLLRRRPLRPVPAPAAADPPAITISTDVAGKSTVIEVVAWDRPALLHDLAVAISGFGCDIGLVLADTRGHRAIDVFYLTRGGRPLDEAAALALRERLERACAARPR